MEWPSPAEGTHLFTLDDEGVLYSHHAQELYSFNTAAALIWSSREVGKTRAETALILGRALRCSRGQATAHITTCLAQWAALGITAGFERRMPEFQTRRREIALPGPPPDLPALQEAPEMIERRYRLLSVGIRVRYQSASQEAWVHSVLAHLEDSQTNCCRDVVVTINGQRHGVYIDGRPYSVCSGLDRLAPYVKAVLWQVAIRDHPHFLHIHAGVVSDGDSLILLPAQSGRGKSTLTAGLIHAGFQYFSDEAALLEEATFRAPPVPVSLCLKAAAWDLLMPLYPDLPSLKVHQRPDHKMVRYMPPPRASLPKDLRRSLPVRRIIFPWYKPTSATAMRRLSKVEALARLLRQCLAVPLNLDPERVAALVQWISGIEAYELVMSSLDDAVRLACHAFAPASNRKGKKLLRPVVKSAPR